MKRIRHTIIFGSVLFSILVWAGSARSASAHIVVRPLETVIRSDELFTVHVPNERRIPVRTVALEIPLNVMHVKVQPDAEWQSDVRMDTVHNVRTIIWSKGSVQVGQTATFSFFAQVPDKPTELHWKAYQTYEDGTVVSWNLPENTPDMNPAEANAGPFSVTRVLASAQEVNKARNARLASGTTIRQDWLLVVGLTSVMTALATVLIAHHKKRVPHKSHK